jgi:hypothetical protein
MVDEREQRAVDAIFVSQLRGFDDASVESLPELNEAEMQGLDSLGEEFIEMLLSGELESTNLEQPEESSLAMAGEAFGMNRAETIDDVTREELDRKRQEIIDRIKREENGDDSSDS